MADQEEVAVQVLPAQGWYRGYIVLSAGARLVDYLNTKPDMISLSGVTDPAGVHRAILVLNTEHVLAIQLQAEG